jgi:hypothetical protein
MIPPPGVEQEKPALKGCCDPLGITLGISGSAARLLADEGIHEIQGGGVGVGKAYALSHLASLLHTKIVTLA